MKSILQCGTLLAIAAEAAASPHILEERQLGSLLSMLTGPGKTAKVLKTLSPVYDITATRAVYTYGPFKLQPSTAKHAATGVGLSGIKLDPNSDSIGGAIVPPCQDCTVYKAIANFAYENGTQADVTQGVYTHHIIIADIGGKVQLDMPISAPKCKNGVTLMPGAGIAGMSAPKAKSGTGSPEKGAHGAHKRVASTRQHQKRQFAALGLQFSVFVGGGGDMGSGHPFAPKTGGNVKSGYHIGKSSSFQLQAEVVNYDTIEKNLYLTLDVEWKAGKSSDLLDVGMGALTADRCDDKEKGIVHPPKDKAISYRGEEWTVTEDGYFVNFTPHIHDGGTKVEVILNGKRVCESRAIYGEQKKTQTGQSWQTIIDYTPCNDAVPIKKGDKVMVTSEYDLTKYKLRPDNNHAGVEAEGMVLVNFIFAKPFSKVKGWFGRI